MQQFSGDGAKFLDRLISVISPDCLFNIITKDGPNYRVYFDNWYFMCYTNAVLQREERILGSHDDMHKR